MKTTILALLIFLNSFSMFAGEMTEDELYGEISINLKKTDEQFDVSEMGLISQTKFKRLSWQGNNLVMNVLEVVYQDTTVSSIMLIKTRNVMVFDKDNNIKSLIITVTDLTQNIMEIEGSLQALTFSMLPSIVYAKSIRHRVRTKELITDKQFEYTTSTGKKIIYTIDTKDISKTKSFIIKIVIN